MLEIKQIFEKEKYIDLVLEADPDKEIVEKYIDDSDMYGLFEEGEILAEVIITKVNDNICELKNIATAKLSRGKGYGKKLIQYVIQLYKNKYKKMIVGTTENNIPFYVKCGFDKYYKTITLNEIANVHGETLELLCSFMERVHESGRVP